MDVEDDVGLCGGGYGALHAEGLDGVVGVAEACGVDDAEGESVGREGFLDGVACSAWGGADDGAVVAEECVEE